jgi:glycerol-3-phosphate acyltransferase PlsY
MAYQIPLLIALAYLLGSIPTAYIAGRWLRGIDLRRYGSGTVSGSMVWEHVSRWAIVPFGLFDVLKAAFPAWLALRLGHGPPVALAAGLAAAVGHNWPVFLHFTGGRAISCFLGIWVVLFPWGAPWILGFLIAGFALGDSAPWALASLATVPLLSALIGGPPIVLPAAVAMVALTLAKRLEANGRPLPPPGPERRAVLWRRLMFDRDIASHQAWIHRRPDNSGQPGAE